MNKCRDKEDNTVETIVRPSEESIASGMNLICNFDQIKQDLLAIYDKRIEHWLQAMDLYDHGITEHTLRVTALSIYLAQGMNFTSTELEYIQYGTLLHDIGKLGIPEKIMQKPGRLTPYEYQVVMQHPVYAHEWLIHKSDLKPAKVIPLFHHERWDGSGYPFGLKGNEIPKLARVVAVVDVWDAITSDRPYRKAMGQDEAISLITSGSGKHFDPDVVDTFMQLELHNNQSISLNFPVCV